MEGKNNYRSSNLQSDDDSEMLNSILRHDTSNYLTVINNYLELLEASNCDQEYMEKIRVTVNQALELIGKVRLIKNYQNREKEIKPINLSAAP